MATDIITRRIRLLLPFLGWPRPTGDTLRRDLIAGFSVGLVLVPQALAYATLAGMPPHTGLYAALLPAIIGALWGSSALLAVGPVALTGILVFGSLSSLAMPGSDQWVAMAIWLALYSGLIQFLLGLFRLGKISYLVSQPVVTGFINAAALIIIFSQLPQLLGLSLAHDNGLALQFQGATLLTAAFGCGAILLLVAARRYLPALPGILLVTILGIVLSWLTGYEMRGGAVVGPLPSGLPSLTIPPSLSFEQHRALWLPALIIALVSFTEAMSSCRVLARRQNTEWDENQELVGQGLAKLTSGFSGAFPVSGSFSRSALNLYAGAVSAWSSLIATGFVLLSLLFLTDLLHPLPYSVLAAIIIIPAFGLLDFGAFRRLYRISKDDAAAAMVTFAATLLFSPDLHIGVFAGVGLTMVSFLYRRTHPRVTEVAPHPDGTLRDRRRFNLDALAPGTVAVRIDSALNFLTATTLERYILEKLRSNPDIRHVLVACSGINDIDASGVESVQALHQTLEGRGVTLSLSAVKKQVWEVLDAAGVIDALGPARLFSTDVEAISHFRLQYADRIDRNPK